MLNVLLKACTLKESQNLKNSVLNQDLNLPVRKLQQILVTPPSYPLLINPPWRTYDLHIYTAIHIPIACVSP